MSELSFSLHREVLIRARRETVFRYFTDSARFAAWWGTGSEIEGRPGGRVLICYPGGVRASGEVLEIEPPRRLVFSYGYEGEDKRIPPGGSRVTFVLDEVDAGTLLRFRHDVADATIRDSHAAGWRYQLALFANVAAKEQHAGVAERVDAWFAAWNEKDALARRRGLERAVTAGVTFRDAYGCTSGLDDLDGHIAALHVHMPGMTIARDGDVVHCQGTAVARWLVSGRDGAIVARGVNVYELAPDGRIAAAVGLWGG